MDQRGGAQDHTTSTDGSIGAYDSLFDDEAGSLGETCFDLDARHDHDVASRERPLRHPAPWCKSSSSSCSCCSLCRPPAVSDSDGDSNAVIGRGNEAAFHSSAISDAEAKTPSASFPNLPSISSCDGHRAGSFHCCCPCGDVFRVPVKSIEIPQGCIDWSPFAEESPTAAPIDGNDYLSTGFLPDDALSHVAVFLDVASLVRLRECNRKLREAASRNCAGWKDHAASLWSSKITVCRAARELLAEAHRSSRGGTPRREHAAMRAYKLSVTDAATRHEISREELCFDGASEGAGLRWSFRFKESAGRDWTSWDPWWSHGPARQLVFLRDGTVRQTRPRGAGGQVQHHCGVPLYDVFSERTVRRDGVDAPAPRIEMRWRFVRRPLDLEPRRPGAYVRVTLEGRDVPTYVVRRSPDGNWGFVLESCWSVYAPFDLAPRLPPSLAPGRGRRLLRRTRHGSRWVDLEESDGEDGDEEGVGRERLRNVRRRIDLFVDETQDRNRQWREAFLYNIGAVSLPEGTAGSEFDSAWRNAMVM